MGVRVAGFALLVCAVSIVAVVLYKNSGMSQAVLTFSPTQVLSATWDSYKKAYLDPTSHRTIDPGRQDVTTSEGESYTMLRAVWMGDKQTFDNSWQFTQSSLEHSQDALFSWLYGQRPDGSYGVLTSEGGTTSASDADSDIALALIFAYARWQDPAYITSAKKILGSMWDNEVVEVGGVPYLTADNLEKQSTSGTVAINPSYFAPYAYRIFAKVDPSHPWERLVDSSYLLLQKSTTAPLGGGSGGMPPDWLALNTKTGALGRASQSSLSSDYGYDALRIPWRIALDWEWNKDPRAAQTLALLKPLKTSWTMSGMLNGTYLHDGAASSTYESPAMYGGAIGYFMVTDPAQAQKVYADKLVYLYNPDINTWKVPLSYYDDNWAWFGIALYNHLLPNLAASLPQSAFITSK